MNTLKSLLRSLFSNQSVVNNRRCKWWLAIVVLLLSLVIAIIPTLVTYNNITPGNIIYATTNNQTYCVDEGLYEFAKSKSGIKITNGKLVVPEDFDGFDFYKSFSENNETVNRKVFSVYYLNVTDEDQNVYTEKVSSFQKEIEKGDEHNIVNSYMLLTPKYFYVKIFQIGVVYDKANDTLADAHASFTGMFEGLDNISFDSFYDDSRDNSFNYAMLKWSTLFNDSYQNIKVRTMLFTSLIMDLMNIAVILILSLTLFLLSRTKNNVNGIRLKFSEAMRIVFIASLSPAILTLLIGFMISTFQQIGFILFLGLRITWLGTKITAGPAVEKR